MTEPELRRMLPDETATRELAAQVAAQLDGGLVIWLEGDLGAGKTVFARSLLQTLGVGERVKSPTYSLVEPYTLADGRPAWHLDLYRIADPAELEWLGLDSLGDRNGVILVEWPERGLGALPAADLHVQLAHAEGGRSARLEARSGRGRAVLASVQQGA